MKGYILNIEAETLQNADFRRVLYTTKHSQLVLMSIPEGIDIGEEIHHLDQFIRIEAGNAQVILDDVVHDIGKDYAVVIPAGTKHNVINTGSEALKLYTIYTPPEHRDGIIEHGKNDVIEEHFDGKTTEQM